MKLPWRQSAPRKGVWVLAALTGVLWTFAAFAGGKQADPGFNPHFPATPSPELPYDVDIPLVNRLDAAGRIPDAQRVFDILSWKAFIALNWPADANGNPDKGKGIGDAGPRVWNFWRNADTIFLPQGAKPEPWAAGGQTDMSTETLFRGKAAWRQGTTNADENFQAFSGPLVDQYGKWVRYEVRVNHEEFDYLVKNELYSLEGQEAFSKRLVDNQIDFPANDGNRKHGAIEIKLAWKEMGPNDDRSRFYTTKAKVILSDPAPAGQTGPVTKTIEVGLVGVHISMRTKSSPEWIWATFEQVDNVRVNDMEHGSGGKTLRPNFNNPDNPSLPPNILPPKNAVIDPKTGQPVAEPDPTKATTWIESKTTIPVQTARVIPIPKATEELNAEVQKLLKSKNSVFQYYELIGTQWPIHPNAPAFAGGEGSAPESIDHKTPGDMVPVFLTNMTMETYFQKGLQPAGPLEQDDRLAATAPPIDSTMVFGTESCVGCHYSAGACIGFKKNPDGTFATDATGRRVAIYGENNHFGKTGNAHFSWLLQIEARSTHDPAPPPPNPATFLDTGENQGRRTLPLTPLRPAK